MVREHPLLPQLDGGLFLTDGGLETTLIYHHEIELPDFAAFPLLQSTEGEATLRRYFRTYAEVARRFRAGLVLETPTWRASPDWGERLGFDTMALAELNRRAVRLLDGIRRAYADHTGPVVISGCVGPRGDGYEPGRMMSVRDAEAYHAVQIQALAATSVDMICAMTLSHVEEAIGISRAARRFGLPAVIAFTVETDGRLATGHDLGSAIEVVDGATSGYPAYYMVNCAHPDHFEAELQFGGRWVRRIRGLRANASCKSHAELDRATDLDIGHPEQLGADYARLKERFPWLNVLGGCCGTDHRHIEQIAKACVPLFEVAA